MPGWESDTWGLHADNGRLFHDGSRRHEEGETKEDEDWTYTTGDVIGCCIDFAQRKAAFTKNGVIRGESKVHFLIYRQPHRTTSNRTLFGN